MADSDRYVIDPGDTDPGLISRRLRSRENRELEQRHAGGRRALWRRTSAVSDDAGPRPARPVRYLLGTIALGPFSVLRTHTARLRRGNWVVAWFGSMSALLAAGVWWQGADVFGRGDETTMIQLGAALLAAALWCGASGVGVACAGRVCGDLPWARMTRAQRVGIALLGLLAPGFGLLAAGRRHRAVTAAFTVGICLVCGVACARFGTWWSWHRKTLQPVLTGLRLEQVFLVCAGVAAVGVVIWLVSVLDGIRLASPSRGGRAGSHADLTAAALLLALIGFGFSFHPGEAARELDLATCRLAGAGLRVAPMLTARASVFLAPGEPAYELRLIERHAAAGHAALATARRTRLEGRWQRYMQAAAAAAGDSVSRSAGAANGIGARPAPASAVPRSGTSRP